QCVSCGAWNFIVEETPLSEPAIDLGIIAAIASLFRDLPVERSTVLIGEVGLSGEIRAVSHLEQRLKESANL
ncbi:MAG: DNA repair protein RadA, partial [Bacteroidetes bacterium]|nr:DNA repair protein RadA [Bacteroidota bacterium]